MSDKIKATDDRIYTSVVHIAKRVVHLTKRVLHQRMQNSYSLAIKLTKEIASSQNKLILQLVENKRKSEEKAKKKSRNRVTSDNWTTGSHHSYTDSSIPDFAYEE